MFLSQVLDPAKQKTSILYACRIVPFEIVEIYLLVNREMGANHDSRTLRSPVWGATLYTNFLAFVPMLIVALSTGEVEDMKQMDASQLSAVAIAWLVISCVIGVGISWSGWNCRNGVSATVFTILGVVCKILSVLMNMLIWNHHSTTPGLVPILDGPFHSISIKLSLARVVAAVQMIYH